MSRWGGRRAQLLVASVLATRGRVCWLCGLEGADSADHDPPRSELLAAGVLDPDRLEYLNPAHLLCSQWRGVRPVTAALRAELRGRRLELEGTPLSASLERRRPATRRPVAPSRGTAAVPRIF